jgi:UDP-2,3-diacylglucosamine pyrophosphatase LpxH
MSESIAKRVRVRTAFISDVHLGFRGCQAEYLLDFLERLDADRLVLVGDIVDLWSLKRSLYWPAAHQEVLRRLIALSRSGTEVIYVPGNHDEAAREFCGLNFGAVRICRQLVHETADGRRLLVLHGDEFDGAVEFSGWLKHFGCFLYDRMVELARLVHFLRRRLGRPYWSLASWIKHAVPNAMTYIEAFEVAAAAQAARRGFDGVVCGHLHRPSMRTVNGILYCNDGDWVEHCTALVEDRNGRLAILNWTELAGVGATRPEQEAGVVLDPAA